MKFLWKCIQALWFTWCSFLGILFMIGISDKEVRTEFVKGVKLGYNGKRIKVEEVHDDSNDFGTF